LEQALNKIEINTEFARDLAYAGVGRKLTEGGDTYEVIANEQIDSSRWSAIYTLVVKIGDKFFKAAYETGLTEYQDFGAFEDDYPTVPFYRVMPREKTITEYVPYTEKVA
jgi:hypothetical protein